MIRPKKDTQLERRGRDRKHTLLYVRVFERHSGELIGQLADVSDNGMLLVSSHELPLGERRQVNVEMPEDAGFDHSHLEAEIEFRWEKPDTNPDYRCTGCLLLSMSDEDREVLAEFSRRLTFEGIKENDAE